MGKKSRFSADILHGSLEMLILRTLVHGPAHGYAIARRLEQGSGDVLTVGESSLQRPQFFLPSDCWRRIYPHIAPRGSIRSSR